MPRWPRPVERGDDARRLVLAGREQDVGAGVVQRLRRGARSGAGHHDRERHLVGLRDELGVQRQAGERVEHDAARLALHAVDAGR